MVELIELDDPDANRFLSLTSSVDTKEKEEKFLLKQIRIKLSMKRPLV